VKLGQVLKRTGFHPIGEPGLVVVKVLDVVMYRGGMEAQGTTVALQPPLLAIVIGIHWESL